MDAENIKKKMMNVVGNLKDNPTSMFAINIYLCIMIFLVSFYFFYYISWDIGKKRITTCNNVVNNIKKFSEKYGVPDYYVSEPRLTMDYGNFDAWKKCSEAGVTLETKNKDAEGKEGNDYVCEDIKLKDHFFMGCYNAAGCGDEWQSYVDNRKNVKGGTVLEAVLDSGVRVVDFELFLKKKGDGLVVGNGIPSEKNKYNFKGSYNEIPFSDILKTLKEFIEPDGTEKIFQNHPLLVNLRIGSNDENIYKKLGALLKADNELLRFTPDNKYLLKTLIYENESNIGENGSSYKDIVDTPIKENNGKIIFILNDNPLNQFGKYIENLDNKEKQTDNLLNYICITDSQYLGIGNAIVSSSNNIINAHNKTEVVNGFKKYLGIALPDWSSIIKNPDYFKHMSMGCQISLLKFSLNDVNLRDYFNYWQKKKTRIVIKPRKNTTFIGLVEDSKDIIEIKKSAPMTIVQDESNDPNSQVDDLKDKEMAGDSFEQAVEEWTGTK